MFDTNVILDVLLKRPNLFEYSMQTLKMLNTQQYLGYISANTITDIYYIVKREKHSKLIALKAIEQLLQIFKIAAITETELIVTVEQQAKDFEDSVLAACAVSYNCDFIITNNIKDFEDFNINVITPKKFLEKQKES